MSDIRILRVRHQEPEPQESAEVLTPATDINDLTQPISKEVIRKNITRISNGFNAWVRKITSTSEGMESVVSEPLLIAQSGHRIEASQIKGQCEVCGGFDAYIFNCFVHGCKKALCLKHVFFFQEGDKQIPLCLKHYQQFVNNRDTWQTPKPRGRK